MPNGQPQEAAPAPQNNPAEDKPQAGGLNLAGGWIRFLALIIDSILIGIVQQIILAAGVDTATAQTINSVITLVYLVVMIGLKQQTVGMMALKLKIVPAKEGKPNWWAIALLREVLGRLVCGLTLGIGYLIMFWTKNKQGLHDMIAKNYVIKMK